MSRNKRKLNPVSSTLGEQFGKTIQRLRTAGDLSIGELSQQSGVAKSMISQIEKNESNPTLATISRLSQALGCSIDTFFAIDRDTALVEKTGIQDTPLIRSEDGLCELRIIGWIQSVEFVQWYDFSAQPGGVLESSPHPPGSIENLSVLEGELSVDIGDEHWSAKSGETLRYRADRPHIIRNTSEKPAHATMVNILAHQVS